MVKNVLPAIAQRTPPIKTRVSGIGIFTGEQPVLYLTVVRTLAMSHLNQQLADHLPPEEYYRPHQWIPHITLLQGQIPHLGRMVEWLNRQPLHFDITLDNIAMIRPGIVDQRFTLINS
jgi:2'-5' RNA ligase